jgi:hypothetical protein
MQRLFVCSFFLAVTGLLSGADSQLAGTRKLNVAKSKPAPTPPGKTVKAETIVIQENGDTATVTISGTREDASAIIDEIYSSSPRRAGCLFPRVPVRIDAQGKPVQSLAVFAR